MVDLSPAKILVVLVVALVVLGPDRLPRAARQAGRLVSDLRRFHASLNTELREAFGDPGALSDLPARGRAWVRSVAADGGSPEPLAATTPHDPPVPPGGPASGRGADEVGQALEGSQAPPPGDGPPTDGPEPKVAGSVDDAGARVSDPIREGQPDPAPAGPGGGPGVAAFDPRFN